MNHSSLQPEDINCLLNCRMSLESCEKRQLSYWRYTNPGQKDLINDMFATCKNCQNWIPDEKYEGEAPKQIQGHFRRSNYAKKNRKNNTNQ